MRRDLIVSFAVIVLSALTTIGLTLGVEIDWPDLFHVNYGFPLVWGTHVLNTIAGPVDTWRVDTSALTLDLMFWLGLIVLTVAFSGLIRKAPVAL